MLRLCDGKVTFFQRKKVTFFYVSAILCIEAGECFPAFKQQNILGFPSGELPEGLVQANLIFRSKATLKSSETPFRVKRDRASRERKSQANLRPFGAPPSKGRREKQSSGIALFILRGAFDFYAPHHSPFEPTDPIDPIEPAPPLSSTIKGRYVPWANPEV